MKPCTKRFPWWHLTVIMLAAVVIIGVGATTGKYICSQDAWFEYDMYLSATNGFLDIAGYLSVDGRIRQGELSADPADPAEGEWILWMSDGTGYGDDGDVCVKIQAGGVIKTNIWIDFSTL